MSLTRAERRAGRRPGRELRLGDPPAYRRITWGWRPGHGGGAGPGRPLSRRAAPAYDAEIRRAARISSISPGALRGPMPPGGASARARPIGFLEALVFQVINPKGWVFAVGAPAAYTTAGGDVSVGDLGHRRHQRRDLPDLGADLGGFGTAIGACSTTLRATRVRLVDGGLAGAFPHSGVLVRVARRPHSRRPRSTSRPTPRYAAGAADRCRARRSLGRR